LNAESENAGTPEEARLRDREAMVAKEDRGFASMDRSKQREIASKGGKAAHQKGTAHEWTSEEAREAGRKGGMASHRRKQQGDTPSQDQPPETNRASDVTMMPRREAEEEMQQDRDEMTTEVDESASSSPHTGRGNFGDDDIR
jgi:uncharacterized protein